MSAKPKLNERRKKFISAYLETLNASEAARKAGYKGQPAVIGSRLLINVNVKTEISKQLEAIIGSEKDTIKRRVLVELQGEAFSPLIVETTSDGQQVFKPNPNRMKALELLSKYVGILVEKHEHTGRDGAPIEIKWPDGSNPTA